MQKMKHETAEIELVNRALVATMVCHMYVSVWSGQ